MCQVTATEGNALVSFRGPYSSQNIDCHRGRGPCFTICIECSRRRRASDALLNFQSKSGVTRAPSWTPPHNRISSHSRAFLGKSRLDTKSDLIARAYTCAGGLRRPSESASWCLKIQEFECRRTATARPSLSAAARTACTPTRASSPVGPDAESRTQGGSHAEPYEERRLHRPHPEGDPGGAACGRE